MANLGQKNYFRKMKNFFEQKKTATRAVLEKDLGQYGQKRKTMDGHCKL